MKSMVRMAIRFDIAFWWRCQRVSIAIQKFSGKTNFCISRTMFLLMPSPYMYWAVSEWSRGKNASAGIELGFSIVYCILAWLNVRLVDRHERSYYDLVRRMGPVMNPALQTLFISRVMILTIVLMGVLLLLANRQWDLLGTAIFMLLGNYFLACTPLPPGTSTVRKLVQKLKALLSPAIGNAQPAPVGS